MKKLLLKITFIFALIAASLTACEDQYVEPPRPACEIGNYCTITIQNNIPRTVIVDIGDIQERYLSAGGSTTYYKVPAGTWRMYIDRGYGWEYKNQTYRACDDMIYYWSETGKKSTENLRLNIFMNEKVIETISEFEKGDK